MTGIRIQNIPNGVTEKQLKVYFSNPKHGGGPITELLYPMPHNTAVIVYEDEKDAEQVLQKNHKSGEVKLMLKPLPRQVYHITQVVLDKQVSEFISQKSDILDELKFVGELVVEFSHERDAFIMEASWYKLEWAMQYLNNMLGVYEFDTWSPRKAKNQDVKHSNIPPMDRNESGQEQPSAGQRRNKNSTDNMESILSNTVPARPKKYKNIAPLDGANMAGDKVESQQFSMKPNIKPRIAEPNIPSKTMKNNLDTEQTRKPRKYVGDWLSDNKPFMATERSPFRAGLNDLDSGILSGPKRNVHFDPAFDFVGGRMFERQMFGKVTKGIDVAATDFGNAPLTYVFEATNGLKVCIAKDDITKQETDCIVNGTSQDLANQYGVSRAIVKAVGQRLQLDCHSYVTKNGRLNVTQVFHTAAGGYLNPKVRFILHTAGPQWKERCSEEVTHSLVCTYINCLQYANLKLHLRSIAMPLISAGTYGFPLDVCVQAFYDAILLVTSSPTQARSLKEVNLICYDAETTMAVIMIIQSLLDCDINQSTHVAIERYRSNVSQNGVGADNFVLVFDDSNSTAREVKQVDSNSTAREVKPVDSNSTAREVKPVQEGLDKWSEKKESKQEEGPKYVKLDDKSDTESEKDESDARNDPAVPIKSISLAARSGYGKESRYGLDDQTTAVAEPKFSRDSRKEFDSEESDDEDVSRGKYKEEEEAEDEEPKSAEENKYSIPNMRDSFKRSGISQRDAEVDYQEKDMRTEEVAESPVPTTGDEESDGDDDTDDDQVERDVKGAGNVDTISDDEADHYDTREQADGRLEKLDEQENMDEAVAKIASLLENVPGSPQNESGNKTSEDDSVSLRDYSMCDSVGGRSMHT